jgi:hypothetical protein
VISAAGTAVDSPHSHATSRDPPIALPQRALAIVSFLPADTIAITRGPPGRAGL